MTRAARLTVTGSLFMVLVATTIWVRPPRAGNVYSMRSSQYALPGSTTLLVQNGGCLASSVSPEDIGRTRVNRATHCLFALATARSVIAGSDHGGAYLEDRSTGLKARAGQAIDGEIFIMAPSELKRNWLRHSVAAGWPIGRECGHSLAILFSIERVRNAKE